MVQAASLQPEDHQRHEIFARTRDMGSGSRKTIAGATLEPRLQIAGHQIVGHASRRVYRMGHFL